MVKQLDWLHALRGIAVLFVVLHHAEVYSAAHFGAAPLYVSPVLCYYMMRGLFIISGFVTYWVYAGDMGQPGKAGAYIGKRFKRIFPIYWLVLAAFYLGLLITPGAGRGDEFSASVLFTSWTLLPSTTDPALYVAWTLKYELVFWAIFGVAIWRPRIGLALGAVVISCWADH